MLRVSTAKIDKGFVNLVTSQSGLSSAGALSPAGTVASFRFRTVSYCDLHAHATKHANSKTNPYRRSRYTIRVYECRKASPGRADRRNVTAISRDSWMRLASPTAVFEIRCKFAWQLAATNRISDTLEVVRDPNELGRCTRSEVEDCVAGVPVAVLRLPD